MKKKLLTLASVILAVIMSLACLAGCNLVTTDDQRDMEQTVATIRISDDFETDVIKKSDMILAYLNYGYMYEQSYGYTRAQVFELIINNLVNSRIMVQSAILDGGFTANDKDFSKYSAAKYLDDEALLTAEYDTLKYLNQLVESYDEDKEEKKNDSFIGEVRTVPSGATNAEKEITKEDKTEYLKDAKNDLVLSDNMEGKKYTRTAFNDVVKLLKNNSLLGDFDGKDLKTTEYYKQTLKNNYESQLLTAYEKKITADVISGFNFGDLESKYTEIYDKQKDFNGTDFVSALSSTTATEPIVYSGFGGYGYVYNLLLGANDIQTTEISKIKEDNKNIDKVTYAEKRAEILANTVIKDLRSSWVLSGYDMEYDTAKNAWIFTGDYTLTSKEYSLPFMGEVKWLNESDKDNEDYAAQYSITNTGTLNLTELLNLVDGYMQFGLTTPGAPSSTPYVAPYIYKNEIKTFSDDVVEYDEKIQELIFAFSTDSGSLNNDKGYNIKPTPDANNSEEYVETFAEAGRKLLEKGGKSYVVVASDYGYHVMFFSQILDNVNYDKLSDYLDTLGIDKGALSWEDYWKDMMSKYTDEKEIEKYSDNYLYLLTDSIISTEITNKQTEIQNGTIDKYRYESEGKVNVYKDVYKDLLG